jgi:hypothetical protein
LKTAEIYTLGFGNELGKRKWALEMKKTVGMDGEGFAGCAGFEPATNGL